MTEKEAIERLESCFDCTDCFTCGSHDEALEVALGALRGKDEVKHFLECEIEITTERLEDKMNPIYDGVYVGQTAAEMLKKNHIRFCQHLLSLMEK